MKKSLLFLFLILFFKSGFGQFEYKVEYSNLRYTPFSGNGTATLTIEGMQLYQLGAFQPGIAEDRFFTTTEEFPSLSFLSTSTSCSGTQVQPIQTDCQGITGTLDCGVVTGTGFVYRIRELNAINDINSRNICEDQFLRVHSCVRGSYSLEVEVRDSNNNIRLTETLLPYDGRFGTYDFDPQNFGVNGISLNDGDRALFTVYHTADRSISKVFTMDFNACPLQLDDTVDPNPQPINSSCSDANDGGFEVFFDRELETGESLTITLLREGPAGGDEVVRQYPNLEPSALPNGVFTSDRNFPSDTYFLEWQLNGGIANNSRNNPFTIESPTPIGIINTITTQTSCQNPLGSVTVVANGGGFPPNPDIPLEYSIVGSGIWQSSPTFNNLAPNDYQFIARNPTNTSCQSAPSVTITINSFTNPVQLLNPSVQRPTAPGLANGEISVSVLGAMPDITYRLFRLPDTTTPDAVFAGPGTTHTFDGLPAGQYIVQVEDANGCERESSTITLEAILVPVLGSPTVSNVSCNGFDDGSISVAISDGETPYNFRWLGNGLELESGTLATTTFARNDLQPGNYELLVSSSGVDINGGPGAVVRTGTIVIADADAVTLVATGVPFECNGDGSGGIRVQANGGSSYEYRLGGPTSPWIALPTNAIVPVPDGGFYTLQIRNENQCESNIATNIQVIEPPQLLVTEVTANRTNVSTNGGSDGAITIGITGGTTPYTFAWIGPNGFTAATQNISGLFAGDYQVVVTDANDCSGTLPTIITITEPGPLGILGFSTFNVLCRNENTGSVTANIEGVAPFLFEWTGPNGFTANTQTISNLFAGTYELTLSDSSTNPSVVNTVTIGEPDAVLSGTAFQTAKSCFDRVDGQVLLSANGGTAPYEYSLDNGNTFQTDPLFADLEALTYTYVIRDFNGCTFDNTVTVDSPMELVVTLVASTDVTTNGGSDGTINVSVNGGTPNNTGAPYSFDWTGPNGFNVTTQNLADLFSGTYQVVVTDANGCTTSLPFPVEITEPGPLTLGDPQATVVDVACFGEASGSITANFSGEAPYTVIWFDNGIEIERSITENTIDDLTVGTAYSYSVTDASGVTLISNAIEVSGPSDALSARTTSTPVSCFGGNDGMLQVIVTGGTQPYRYSDDNGITFQNSEFFIALQSGSYEILVLDDNDCEFNLTGQVVTQPEQLAIDVDLENISEAGIDDGSITITVTGGTAPYSYEWTGPNGFSSTEPSIQNLSQGNYILVVRDANSGSGGAGCTLNGGFTISEPGAFAITTEITVPLECNGDEFGELAVTASGGIPPYTYQWFTITNTGNPIDLNTDDPIIGNLGEGTYSVRVTDFNGISRDSDAIVLNAPDLLTITMESITNVSCFGENTGAIDITIAGGTAPYSILWSNGAITEDISNITEGTYTVSVLDVNNCFVEREYTVENASGQLEVSTVEITNVSSFGGTDGAIAVVLQGGAPPYQITWRSAQNNSIIGNDTQVGNLIAGNYILDVTDANNCFFTETFTITQPDIIEAVLVPPTCSGGIDGSIALSVNEGTTANLSYAWNTGATTATIENLSAGTYSVVITGLLDTSVTREYVLEDPAPIEVDLGDDQVLCLDQTAILDATVENTNAQYLWTSENGFSSTASQIIVSETGNYLVTVTSETGCVAMGSVFIEASTAEISADFAVSNQVFVGESFVAVDLSFPIPDTLTWIYPEEAEILNEDEDALELRFLAPGTYEIGVLTSIGDCIALATKQVLVLAPDNAVNADEDETMRNSILDFILAPNPTNGNFTAQVSMSDRGNISIKIFQFASNNLVAEVTDRGSSEYSIPMDISGNPSGLYAVVLETPFGTTLRKLVLL